MSAAVGVRRQRFIWSITYAHWLCYGVLVFDAQRSTRHYAEWRGKVLFWAGEDKIIYGPHFRVGRPVALSQCRSSPAPAAF